MPVRLIVSWLFVSTLFVVGCGDDDTGTPPPGDRDSGVIGFDSGFYPDGAPIPPMDSGSGPSGDAAEVNWEAAVGMTQCSDGRDNDGDGLTDGFDPECTSALDNDESSFATGIPGDNRDPFWQDCFFDGNSGAGDDHCRYHTDCLYGRREPTDPDCSVSAACLEYCGARTPPGCDCFGCCAVETSTGSVNILLTPTCSLANIADETACPRCTPTTACVNECGTCELCLGRTIEDLPPECTPDGGMIDICGTEGQASCTPDMPCADPNTYCMAGCCVPFLI